MCSPCDDFRTRTRQQPSTAPASAPLPGTLYSSWWKTPCRWPPSTLWATLSSFWRRYFTASELKRWPLTRSSKCCKAVPGRPQVLVVSCTAFAGVLALNYQKDYTVWVLPLLIVLLFAFLVAHCFLSVFENVVDVLFLCFAVDMKYNDGSPGREFYMDKSLMVRPHQRFSGSNGSFPQINSSLFSPGHFSASEMKRQNGSYFF